MTNCVHDCSHCILCEPVCPLLQTEQKAHLTVEQPEKRPKTQEWEQPDAKVNCISIQSDFCRLFIKVLNGYAQKIMSFTLHAACENALRINLQTFTYSIQNL